MESRAELSSMATTLGELARRMAGLADALNTGTTEAEAAVLYDVERQLNAASRRLDRLLEGKLR